MANVTVIPTRSASGPRLAFAGFAVPLWTAYALAAIAGLAGLTAVYLFDPRNPGLYPICPFFGLTGCYCPGCGTLRALHQLLHRNIAGAFGYNPYSMLALPAIGYSLAVGGLRAYRLPAPPRLTIPGGWIWALLAAILAFWLLRNLPFGAFAVLAP